MRGWLNGVSGVRLNAISAALVTCLFGWAAPAAAQSINLEWDPSPTENLAGYRIYSGVASGSYSQSTDLPAGTTTYTFVNATPNVKYYFVVTAFTTDGLESGYSNEVTGMYFLPAATPVPISPSGMVATNTPSFSWQAADNATSYALWVNDSTGKGRIEASYTAAQAGCSATCTVSPGVTLSGSGQWFVKARNAASESTWSAPMAFTLPAGADTSAPSLAITAPVNGLTVNGSSVVVSGTSSDNVAVTQVTWRNSAGGSGAATGTSTWSATVPLQSGSNAITVTARDAANNTRQASVTVNYVAPALSVPSTPVLVSPSGSSSTTQPQFSWNAVANATAYVLWANDGARTGKLEVLYTAAQAGCGAGSGACAVAPGVALSGTVQWWVQARNSAGESKWSAPLTFTVPSSGGATTTTSGTDTTPPSLAITSPGGAVTVATAYIAMSGTAGDNVGVSHVGWSTDRGATGTVTGTTSWSASIPLQQGANVITVTARDAANNTRHASITITSTAAPTLSVSTGGVPVAPVLVGPSGGTATNTPSFTWNAVSNATRYVLWANDGSMNRKIEMLYTAAQAGCGAGTGTCTVAPGMVLTGTVHWWVQARNSHGEGPWSKPMGFLVGAWFDAPSLVAPNDVAGRTPMFTWTAVAGATSYIIWVNDSAMNGRVQRIVTPSEASCAGGGNCVILSTTPLATGKATWWVRAMSATAESWWSVPLTFTVQ